MDRQLAAETRQSALVDKPTVEDFLFIIFHFNSSLVCGWVLCFPPGVIGRAKMILARAYPPTLIHSRLCALSLQYRVSHSASHSQSQRQCLLCRSRRPFNSPDSRSCSPLLSFPPLLLPLISLLLLYVSVPSSCFSLCFNIARFV